MKLAIPIAIGMVFQTLYYLVDLYFVAQLGESAIAGLTSAGNVQFLVMALTQILGVGTMALIAQASGRKDRDDANLIFNQSLGLAAVCATVTLIGGYALAGRYMGTLGADAATVRAGTQYLHWFLPGLGLQFALVTMGSALRGTGIVKPTIFVQVFTVVLNAILSPIMIAGWVTGHPLGVLGAGLSTSISISIGMLLLRGEGARRFVDALDTAMLDQAALKQWYLSVIATLAGRIEIQTSDINWHDWCEVDFPHDIGIARKMTAAWRMQENDTLLSAGNS